MHLDAARSAETGSEVHHAACAHLGVEVGVATGYLWAAQEMPDLLIAGQEGAAEVGLLKNNLSEPFASLGHRAADACRDGRFDAAVSQLNEATQATHALIQARRQSCVDAGFAPLSQSRERDIPGFPPPQR